MHQPFENKIKSLHELAKIAAGHKRQGRTLAQCHGVFDLLHLGHIRHFRSAKRQADVLIVTLTADKYVKRGPGRPYFNEHLRAEALSALTMVDYVCVLDHPTAVEAIRAVRPDIYAKGSDYRDKKTDVTGMIYAEQAAVKSVGGRIVITDDIVFSSSGLINHYLEIYPRETVRYLKDFAARFPMDGILLQLKKIRRLKILVIGDAIVDQYHYCLAMGKSSKENLVVNKYLSDESFAGGALATANHARELSGSLDFLTVLGKENSFDKFIRSHLSKGIRPIFMTRPDAPTTVKRRFVNFDGNKKLFEICYMEDRFLPPPQEVQILRFLNGNLKKYDLVIAADFGHGLITQKIIDLLCAKSKRLAVNVQTNSANIGFNLVTKYPRADYVCVDEMELRLAMHERLAALPELVQRIQKRMHAKQVMVTRGKDGALGYRRKEGFYQSPALSYHIVDKVGAGDAFFACTAPCFAVGMPQEAISFIGNAAGSIAVQIICNREPVKYADLIKFMTRLTKFA
jgi:rfaE bifunctional protein nucleotidyltransferase chain/domain